MKVNYSRGYRNTMIEVIAPEDNDRRYYGPREWVYRIVKFGNVRYEGVAYTKANAIRFAKDNVNKTLAG